MKILLLINEDDGEPTSISVYAHTAHGLALAQADAKDRRAGNGSQWKLDFSRPLSDSLSTKEVWEGSNGSIELRAEHVFGYKPAVSTGK